MHCFHHGNLVADTIARVHVNHLNITQDSEHLHIKRETTGTPTIAGPDDEGALAFHMNRAEPGNNH